MSLKSDKDVKEIFEKMEVYYLANKSENLYFTLLGDCTSSNKVEESFDKVIIKEGIDKSKELNDKYGEKFFFTYRKREWAEGERCFMGWERKRGMLNQFNEFLVTGKSEFKVNTCNLNSIQKIKYVITIDSDTELIMDSAIQLVGAMSHILNKPEVDKIKNIVVKGHGIIQPRVAVDMNNSRKSLFTRVFSGNIGLDIYSSAASDVYQDLFGEGIFIGKGIYDLDVFYSVLRDSIPENKVLSHDLLEGNFLRCGLANDIFVLDGYPTTYGAYRTRKHRWIRGDIQIFGWLGSTLGFLSKYKIWDNLIRHLNEVFILLVMVIGMLSLSASKTIIPLLLLLTPFWISLVDLILTKKASSSKNKLFASYFSGFQVSLFKAVMDIILLPDTANLELDAILKAIYRMKISHTFLLEWTTASEAEKSSKKSMFKYFEEMIFSSILGGLILVGFILMSSNFAYNDFANLSSGILHQSWIYDGFYIFEVISCICLLMWIFSPAIMWLMSKPEAKRDKSISDESKRYLLGIAQKTWNYFKDNMTNYLVSDNLQEDRREKAVKRTSSTNIGLEILAIIASYDLGFEKRDYVIDLLGNVISTVYMLPKWNGHLYNWYDIEKLVPIRPLSVSSVDSANFIAYMYTLKQFLIEQIEEQEAESSKNDEKIERINKVSKDSAEDNKYEKFKLKNSNRIIKLEDILVKVNKIIEETDFSVLYDAGLELFSIGYNLEENKLYNSYYDLLASEARQISLISIAKKDVPSRHWNTLGRTLTTVNQYKGLVSWGGTTFEYLMPNIIIPTYESSLLDESCKLLIMSQKEYARKLNIPWGISESAYSLKDFKGNYQYKTFGIPWLGLKRGLSNEIVVSPYSTALALTEDPIGAISNFKRLEEEGAYGKYGFYEAIDYKPKKQIIKTYMAHHQGMILASIDNELMKNIFQERFMKNPEMNGIKILLQEKVPENVVINKDTKSMMPKIEEKEEEKFEVRNSGVNVISTNKLSVIDYEDGSETSKINNIVLTTDNNVYIKDVDANKVYNLQNSEALETIKVSESYTYKSKVEKEFSPYLSRFKIESGNLKIEADTTIAPDIEVAVREIRLKNKGLNKINLEITTSGNPILSEMKQHEAHPAFNNMFLRFEADDKKLIATRKARNEGEESPFLATTLFAEEGTFEYEIDKEKFIKRGNFGIPDAVKNSTPLSKKTSAVLNPIISMRRIIELEPNETKSVYLIASASYDKEQALRNLEEYMNFESLERVFDLSRAQTEAEIRYMGIDKKTVSMYQKMLKFLLLPDSIQKQIDKAGEEQVITNKNINDKEKAIYQPMQHMQNGWGRSYDIDVSNENLWKYGISGDYPILLVKMKDVNDFYVVGDAIKSYEYFLSKNIQIELVIVSKADIRDKIIDLDMEKYLNKRAGIFLLNNLTRDKQRIIEIRANLIIDAHDGSLFKQMSEMDDIIDANENKETIREKALSNSADSINLSLKQNDNLRIDTKDDNQDIVNKENLVFYNGYGGFTQDGLEYWIVQSKNNRLPLAWSNILTNKNFGSVVTDTMGGYSWYVNSRTNRITEFSNDSYMDKSHERIIFEMYSTMANLGEKNTRDNWKLDNLWSLTLNDKPEDGEYYTCFGIGYVKYIHSNVIMQECIQYVPMDNNCKVSNIRLKNNLNKEVRIKIRYELDIQMGENREDSRFVRKLYKSGLNMIMYKNLKNSWYNSYITSNENINENAEVEITLKPDEEKNVIFVFGAEENEMDAISSGAKYIANYDNEYEATKKYWSNLTGKVKSNTPLKSFDIMQNAWLVYQTIASRMMGRTGFYQSSGGYGFRDQLQDSLGMKYVNPEILKNQILLCSRHQFAEGDVEHWWHEDSDLGIRTRFSDDLLWLPYAVLEYIDFTGDYSILNEEETYLIADELGEDEEDRVDYYRSCKKNETKEEADEKIIIEDDVAKAKKLMCSNAEKGTIFNHCIRAIERALRFGKNGLPLMKSGDWNDGMNRVANKEVGESVWLGFFLYDILIRFIDLIDYESQFAKQDGVSKEVALAINGDSHREEVKVGFIQDVNGISPMEEKEKFKVISQDLKKALNSVGWDGRWFKRAFSDDGKEIGSIKSEECKIDSIAQSWSVISNAGDNDKKHLAIQSAENYLIDNDNNLVRLLYPALEKMDLGYISSYAKGLRENGGQYTHAAIWLLIAESMLGYNEKAMDIYKKINPIEHSLNKESADKYKVEPYVVEADISSEGTLAGRGGWTWYTGSSSWLYKAQIEYILGIRINKGILTINPCVLDDWDKFDVILKYFDAEYHIFYERTGNNAMLFNDKETNEIFLNKTGNYEVKKYF